MANPWDNDPIVAGPQQGPTVTPLPISPKDQAREARDNAAASRDDIRTAIAARGEGRDISKTRFEQAQKLRESFEGRNAVKTYQTILRQYAAGIGAEPSVAGDQKLINSYAQMLNPTSTVMLGEYQATEQVDPVVQQIQNRLKKEFGWDGAGRISEQARKQLLAEMFDLTVNANQSYNQDRAYFSGLAEQYGYTPNEVVGPHLGDPFRQDIYEQRLAEKGWARDAQGNIVFAPDDGSQTGPDFAPDDGLRGSVTDDRPDYRESTLGQGMSGVNEGIASTLGLPVDLLTAGLNLVPQGINAIANTNLPTIQDPVGGSGTFRRAMDGWGIYGQTQDPGDSFVRRVGQSIGAAAVPAGFAGSLPRAGAAIFAGAGGGVGAATAQRAAPGNIGAEMAGELLGGGLAGAGVLNVARRNAQRGIEAKIPTIPQLREQAGDLYQQAEQRGVTAGPMQTQQLRDEIEATLRNEGQIGPAGRISDADTNTTKAFNLIDQYAGLPMRPTEMDTVRGVIAEGRKSMDASDQRLAGILTNQFDDWARPMAPEFDEARGVASRYLQAEDIAEARDLARASASQFGQSGLENALRTQFRGLDRATIRGTKQFAPEVTEAIQAVGRGTTASNLARNVGRFAPTGPVSFAASVGGGGMVGNMIGGPVGGAVGASLGLIGAGGRGVANAMTNRAVDVAELTARNGGAIPQASVIDQQARILAGLLAASEAGKYIPEKKKRRGIFGGR